MISDIKIEPLQIHDLASVSELQPPTWADIRVALRYFIESPFCNPLKVTQLHKIIGLGNSLLHQDTAWLSSIIVHPLYRNQGLSKRIREALLTHVKKLVDTIYLDATEFGYPVYNRLGFETETEYIHLRGKTKSILQHNALVPFLPNTKTGSSLSIKSFLEKTDK